jgi:tripartite-type tricarboxylate transporter receptor subunit TctC
LLGVFAAFATITAWTGTTQAQGSYPNRTLRMIVPFAAGGATDSLDRVLAQSLGERLGQQVIVENRPGGGGVVGSEVGARAAPDATRCSSPRPRRTA